jgi:hypothetical protein
MDNRHEKPAFGALEVVMSPLGADKFVSPKGNPWFLTSSKSPAPAHIPTCHLLPEGLLVGHPLGAEFFC